MQKTKPTNRASEEAIFSILMLVFAIFEIVLLTVILARAATPSRQNPQDTVDSETESESESETETDLPPESRPVFSGGVIPSLPTPTAQTATLSSIDSKYAVLVNAETGEIVAGRNFDTVFSPASMTKVMTLIVACENLTKADLERKLPLTEEIVQYVTSGEYAGTEVALPREVNGITCIGDTYRIEDLLYGIGVMSAADCTYMIAKEISGSEEAFVALMNQKAADMGLTHTHFDNAVGFDSPTNVTTAREMAVILAYAMQSETIADILKPRSERMPIQAHYVDGLEEKTYKVWFTPSFQSRLEKYPDFSLTTSTVQATKTGYTTESFLALAASSKKDRAQYILILGDADSGASEKISEKFKNTMLDTESILNTYIP
ncbi:MAG: D-alanyl-D-alanine carboxypeptidase [Clostridia bacterium]|nr:D-alanyl-D-alanine carboxypeptidase [Clostridia bacterium]